MQVSSAAPQDVLGLQAGLPRAPDRAKRTCWGGEPGVSAAPLMKCEHRSRVEAELFSSHGQLFSTLRMKYSVFIVGRSFDKLLFPCQSLPPYFLLPSV